MDFDCFYHAPPEHLKPLLNRNEIKLENVGFVKQYPYGSRYNLNLHDIEAMTAVLHDVVLYKQWGGGSIVENSSHGLKRDLAFLCKVAETTLVNVIAGTGHYVQDVQDADTLKMSIEQLVDLYTNDMIVGSNINGTMVKCGFIGEVGSNWPIYGSCEIF